MPFYDKRKSCAVGLFAHTVEQQGWGLVAVTSFEKGEMVIEYVGELVRRAVADVREKNYNSKVRAAQQCLGDDREDGGQCCYGLKSLSFSLSFLLSFFFSFFFSFFLCLLKFFFIQGIGCYMFSIMNTNYVIDATRSGNAARFINHSCQVYTELLLA